MLRMLSVIGTAPAEPGERPTLMGTRGGPHAPLPRTPWGAETLFRGDLGADLGLGCSNSAGTAGGPNEFAVGVAAAVAPPFFVVSTTYTLFTQVSPNVSSLSFVAWADSAGAPGLQFGRQAGLPFAAGNSTAAITPMIAVRAAATFFFGLHQRQADAGLRVGLDTDSGDGKSFIRAPACGAGAFFDVTAVGFPGNWVMAAVVDDSIPVELTAVGIE